MSDVNDKSIDVFGIKPVAKSVEKVTEATVDGARAFMARICLPAAEEFGLLLQDYVKSWRASNATKLARKAEQKVVNSYADADVKVHPRIAHSIFEEGSWTDDETIHDMWAGLLASSCDYTGHDDSNLIFIAILKQLTVLQVQVIRYGVENSNKYISNGGWPFSDPVECPLDILTKICQTDDVIRIDRELDHLRTVGLIGSGISGGGFSPGHDIADITPTPLALNLYVRGEGFIGSLIDYWDLKKKTVPDF